MTLTALQFKNYRRINVSAFIKLEALHYCFKILTVHCKCFIVTLVYSFFSFLFLRKQGVGQNNVLVLIYILSTEFNLY